MTEQAPADGSSKLSIPVGNLTWRPSKSTSFPVASLVLRTIVFIGCECFQASRFVEQSLGQITDDQFRAEFHQTATRQQHLHEDRLRLRCAVECCDPRVHKHAHCSLVFSTSKKNSPRPLIFLGSVVTPSLSLQVFG